MKNNRERQKASSAKVIVAVIAASLLGSLAKLDDPSIILRDPEGIAILIIIAVSILFGLLIAKAAKRRRIATRGEEYERRREDAQEARYVKLRLVQRKLRGLRIATIVLFGVMMLIAFNISARYEDSFYTLFALMILALIVIWIAAPIVQYRRINAVFRQTEDRPRTAEADTVKRGQGRTYSPENFDLDEYDRQKRLEQLDVFLENGIIDREEYRRMKERYEKM